MRTADEVSYACHVAGSWAGEAGVYERHVAAMLAIMTLADVTCLQAVSLHLVETNLELPAGEAAEGAAAAAAGRPSRRAAGFGG